MFFKPKPMTGITAPMTGTAVKLCDVPDPIFAEKIVGDGIAIIPTGGEVVAPVGGRVVQIAHTQHALAMKNEAGIEFLIHMGIDTVQMKEQAFSYCVKVGDEVGRGDVLLRVDWEKIRDCGYNTISPCLILNYKSMKQMKFYYGEVTAGKTRIMDVLV